MKGENKTSYTENKGSTIINKSRYDHYSFPLSSIHSTNVKTPIFEGNKAIILFHLTLNFRDSPERM